MRCSDIERFVDPYLDDEFGDLERVELESHLDSCPNCTHLVSGQVAIRTKLKTCGARAPESLTLRIREELNLDIDPVSRSWRIPLAALALVTLFSTTAAIALLPDSSSLSRISGDINAVAAALDEKEAAQYVQDAVAWHSRRLPMDVESGDGEDVKHFFNNQLEFPVQVPHFHAMQVSVVGGRLAQIGKHRAALISLEVHQRRMSLMVFPGQGFERLKPRARKGQPQIVLRRAAGYNVAFTKQGNVGYSFVSDLPEKEMRQVVQQVGWEF